MADPTVDVGKHSWRIREAEVGFPALEIRPERFAHLREASSGTAPGQLAHALLHAFDGLRGYAPPHAPSLPYPEGEAEELGVGGAGHLALGLVDAQLELAEQLAQ